MMLKLILEAFISISGIAAASGIVYNNDELHIVSDNTDNGLIFCSVKIRIQKMLN